MAGENVGAIYTEIRIALDKLGADITNVAAKLRDVEKYAKQSGDKVTNQFDKMGKDIGKSITNMNKTGISQFISMFKGIEKAVLAAPIVGLFLGIAATVKKVFTGIIDWVNETSKAYIEHQQEIAKIDTVLKTTGSSAWITTRQVTNSARELASTTGRNTNEIMKMQAVILGFNTIVGDSFDRASKVIVDMVDIMGGDLVSTANIAGKALDDPISGMTALYRQGIKFSDELKEQITLLQQSGQKMAAQNLILKQMEEFCKGTASAMNDVNAAQSRLETATERLKIAQGEATSGMTVWWANVRAGWKEARAEHQEMINAANRFAASDYSKQINQIEQMRDLLKDAADGWDKIIEEGKLTLDKINIQIDELNDSIATNERILGAMRNGIKLKGVDYSKSRGELLRYYRETIASQQEELRLLEQKRTEISNTNAENVSARNEEKTYLDNISALIVKAKEAEELRKKTIEEIERSIEHGLINDEQRRQQIQATYQAEAASVNSIISLWERLDEQKLKKNPAENAVVITALDTALENLNGRLNDAADGFNNFAKAAEVKGPLTPEQLNKYIDDILKTIQLARRAIQDDHDQGIDDEEKYMERLLNVDKAAVQALTSFAQQHGVMWSENLGAWSEIEFVYDRLGEQLGEIAVKQQSAAQTKWLDEYRYKVELLNADEKKKNELQIENAVQQLKNSEVYKNAVAVYNEETGEMIKSIEDVQTEMEELLKLSMRLKDEGSNALKKWVEGMDVAMQGFSALRDLFTAIWKEQNEQELRDLEQRYAEEQEMIEDFYDKKLEQYERDYQNQLYYLGLGKAVSQEHHEEDLRHAVETGDQKLIFKAHQALKEFEIRKDYEDDVKAAEDEQRDEKERKELEYNLRKSQLEHQAAIQQWGIQLSLTTASVAQAIMQAWGQAGPIAGIPLAALMTGIGAAQVAAVVASKPKLQSFDSGGLVDGSYFMGDRVLARVNSGEMVLNRRQQKNMFDAIDNDNLGNGGTPIVIENTIILDGQVIAKNTVTHINNRQAGLIQNRCIL